MSVIKRVDDRINVTFDWSDALPDGTTVDSVVHTVPNGLTKDAEGSATTSSYVRISGGNHGGNYKLKAVAELSNGETLVEYATITCFTSS